METYPTIDKCVLCQTKLDDSC